MLGSFTPLPFQTTLEKRQKICGGGGGSAHTGFAAKRPAVANFSAPFSDRVGQLISWSPANSVGR